MSTQTEEKPVDQEQKSREPKLWHTYHGTCNAQRGLVGRPGSVALCGHVRTSSTFGIRPVGAPPPTGYVRCVVCTDLREQRFCGACGGKTW